MKAKVQVFDTDAATNAGYVYTTDQRLSSRLATKNLEDLILKSVSFEGKKVLDIGCGDGHFTRKFWERGKPLSMVGVDPAPSAVAVAASKNDDVPQMNFVVGDGHQLPWRANSGDRAMIQGVLPHDDQPWETIAEAFRLAPEVVILEPNGNNLGLKVIEKVSRYHREQSDAWYAMNGRAQAVLADLRTRS
ncbi:MAG TPA: class I SAM-dependent methyltransferase, partial [Actinomycetota bacterium]|nr:class I SAM-dependent methyltransferase [Actinomycetota bacterium]